MVPCTSVTMEPYCVKYPVCRKIPVCVPVICCPPPCCPPPCPTSQKTGNPEWFARLINRAQTAKDADGAIQPCSTK
jgi:hypothetical protein